MGLHLKGELQHKGVAGYHAAPAPFGAFMTALLDGFGLKASLGAWRNQKEVLVLSWDGSWPPGIVCRSLQV